MKMISRLAASLNGKMPNTRIESDGLPLRCAPGQAAAHAERSAATTRSPIMRRSVAILLAIAALAIASYRCLRLSGLAPQEPAADAAKIA